jgi:hypothetical protein
MLIIRVSSFTYTRIVITLRTHSSISWFDGLGDTLRLSSPMGSADDDSGDDGPSQVDGGDNDYIME